MTDSSPLHDTSRQHWTPLRVYTGYRLVLASMMLALFMYTRHDSPVLGTVNPSLFLWSSLAFMGLSLVALVTGTRDNRAPLVPILTDIGLLALMVHASGGIHSNLTVLLIVTVAAASILLPGRLGVLSAAVATLAMMGEQLLSALLQQSDNPLLLTESAALGLAFFAVALITHQVGRRLQDSERLATDRLSAILQLEALNRQVVNRMRTGVVVVDADDRVRLVNASAQEFFPTLAPDRPLPERLATPLASWRQAPQQPLPPLAEQGNQPEIDLGIAPLGGDDGQAILFLENRARLVQEAQQLKMASLGRLSATIAHEIRNPLSAIQQAAELLQDAAPDTPEDRKLFQIIHRHVQRVNNIVTDVLGLTRAGTARIQRLELAEVARQAQQRWIERGLDPESLQLILPDGLPPVRFDPQQLEQVVDNLLNNAQLHGRPPVALQAGVLDTSGQPWLAVRDHGSGIGASHLHNIFEPFFTTSREGTGLGLFVCRGICEAHQAHLHFEDAAPGTRFVITFAHPNRVFQ